MQGKGLHVLTRLITDLWTWCVLLISNIALIFLIQPEICGLLLHNSAAVFFVGGTVFSSCKRLWITQQFVWSYFNDYGKKENNIFFQNTRKGNTTHVISRVVQTGFFLFFILYASSLIQWNLIQHVNSTYQCCQNCSNISSGTWYLTFFPFV